MVRSWRQGGVWLAILHLTSILCSSSCLPSSQLLCASFSDARVARKDRPSSDQSQPIYRFRRVWAYLMKGEQRVLSGKEPLTDLAYFSASVNEVGELNNPPERPKLPANLAQCRVHLVVSSIGNRSLIYWCLARDQQARAQLIAQIVEAASSFEGVQIDFESIRPEEGAAFCQFLRQLKAALPKRSCLSVAVPARTRKVADAFNYAEIGAIADQVVIMAYDEHWRTSGAGPIASLAWCQRVHSFAAGQIPRAKLVMGLPLYGRVWPSKEVAAALKYPQVLELWKLYRSPVQRLEDETPHFEYEQSLRAQVYFEDLRSLSCKLGYYQQEEVESVAFWRLGQGPAALWNRLEVK